LFCAIASRSVSDTDPFLRHRSDGFPLRIRHRAVESFSRQQCRNGRLASERLTNETVQVRQQKRVDVRPNWKEPTADAYQARSPLICPKIAPRSVRMALGCTGWSIVCMVALQDEWSSNLILPIGRSPSTPHGIYDGHTLSGVIDAPRSSQVAQSSAPMSIRTIMEGAERAAPP
jgi:hypothetical protein